MNTLTNREDLIKKLGSKFQAAEKCLAFFESGSAAFARVDEYSDIDLGIVVEDDFEAEAIHILEQALQEQGGIELSFIMPQPTWHGFWQGFYKLKGMPPSMFLDVCIIKQSKESYFTEREIHGVPVVLFDKTGKVGHEHLDCVKMMSALPARIIRIEFIRDFLSTFVEKEIRRGRLTDAMDIYINMLLRALVELYRIKYDTARYSFGFRYLLHDMPEHIYIELEPLFFINDAEELMQKQAEVVDKINTLLTDETIRQAKAGTLCPSNTEQ